MLDAWLRRALVEGATRAPRPVLAALPPALGLVAWALSRRQRAGVRENLRHVMPGQGRLRRLAAELGTFSAYARSLAEGTAALADPRRPVTLELEGREHLDRALESGRGVVLLTAHTTGFEIAGGKLAGQLGRRVAWVMARERDADARRVSDEVRRRAGVEVIHVGGDVLDALSVLRALRDGAVVGVHVDRVPAGASASPPLLFGRPLARGPLWIAARAGVPVVPVWTRREGQLRVRVRAHAPIELPRRAAADDVDAALVGVAASLSAWIRDDPSAWMDWGR